MGDYRNQGYGRRPDNRGPPPRPGFGAYHTQQRADSQYNQRKRGREPAPPPEDPTKLLITNLLRLGSVRPKEGEDEYATLEFELDRLVRQIKKEFQFDKEQKVLTVLVTAIVEISTRTAHYALLIALLSSDHADFAAKVVDRVHQEFQSALATGERDRARMLLRFLAACTVTNVVHTEAVLSLMEQLTTAALIEQRNEALDPTGHTWQPWTDYLVYIVLAALPWFAFKLAEDSPNELFRLMDSLGKYMILRATDFSPELAPFQGGLYEGDHAARSDSGGNSFLTGLWEAVQQCKDDANWRLALLPELHAVPRFKSQISDLVPHDIAGTQIPSSPPGAGTPEDLRKRPCVVAARLLQRYPPRGGLHLLDPKTLMVQPAAAEGEEPVPVESLLERFIVEEYTIDTITFMNGDRVMCSQQLATGLGVEYDYMPLLAQTLFSQMLRLPGTALPPIAYSAIMIDLCKLKPQFARAMSGCVRESFARMRLLDPELKERLAVWLAYHLSNFQYMWPWEKWRKVLDAPPSDAQRHFCASVLRRLERLSYWERVLEVLPDDYKPLLGPKPEARLPRQLLSPEARAAADAAAAAAAAPSTAAGAPSTAGGEGGAAEGGMEVEQNPDAQVPEWADATEEEIAASAVLERVRDKMDSLQIVTWVTRADGLLSQHGAEGLTRVLTLAMLAWGAKSHSHWVAVTGNRVGVIVEQVLAMMEGDTLQNTQAYMVRQVVDVWASDSARLLMSVETLLENKLVTPSSIVHYVMRSPLLLDSASDPLANDVAWELLDLAAHHAALRVDLAQRMLDKRGELVAQAEQKVRNAIRAAQDAAETDQSEQREVDLANKREVRACAERDDLKCQLEALPGRLLALTKEQDALTIQIHHALSEAFLTGMWGHQPVEGPPPGDGGGEDLMEEEANGEEEGGDSREEKAQRRIALAHVRAFTRRYHLQAARVLGAIKKHLDSKGPPDLQAAVLGALRVPPGPEQDQQPEEAQ